MLGIRTIKSGLTINSNHLHSRACVLQSIKKQINILKPRAPTLCRSIQPRYPQLRLHYSTTQTLDPQKSKLDDLPNLNVSTTPSGKWETVVGLEIHAQIASKSKLFSDAPNQTEDTFAVPNTKVAIMDAAFPGTLPVLNEHCVNCAIKAGLALSSTINSYSTFDRKHYFYCDLPHGYQITQYYAPVVSGGSVSIEVNGKPKQIRISHIQLEQDSGKSIHDQHPDFSLVDLNRAGVPLLEIVTKPDMRSSEEAGAFVAKLQHLLRHIGVSDANMEQGEFRCDVNVSVHREDDHTTLGVRTEIKNLNSIKFVVKAIEYEAQRHIELLEKGENVKRETRFYDPFKGTTFSLRRKEDEVDYRFMPEPDLPPLIIEDSRIEELSKTMPELPDVLKERFAQQYKLSSYEIEVIFQSRAASFFEEVAKNRNPKKTAAWIINDLFGLLNENNKSLEDSPISSTQLGKMIDLIEKDYISSAIGKEVLLLMFKGDNRDPQVIVDEKGWAQSSDTNLLETMCQKLIDENPKEVEKWKQGRERVLGFFVGQILKMSKGKANPKLATDLVRDMLNKAINK